MVDNTKSYFQTYILENSKNPKSKATIIHKVIDKVNRYINAKPKFYV